MVGVVIGCRVLSGFADLLPVVSGVFGAKSLTINGVSFSSIGFNFWAIDAYVACSSAGMFLIWSWSPR